MGGGVGINYDATKDNSNFINQYVELIKSIFKGSNKKIIIEPGRFLVADSGILVTRVL